MKTTGADSLEMGTVRYERHRPEQTLPYEFVERHYPVFVEHLAEAGKPRLKINWSAHISPDGLDALPSPDAA